MAEKKITFEESLKKLELAAEKLKAQDTSLEDAITNYEEGLKHYRECSRILDEAQQKVEVLTK
ncbi:MAG: exodeoxyribonuclease VII small subunit [Bacillota bacterium]|nr:exodeoxyribonuclease VII small subunit [Bacillota bacterium]